MLPTFTALRSKRVHLDVSRAALSEEIYGKKNRLGRIRDVGPLVRSRVTTIDIGESSRPQICPVG